jgi:starch phosphorylase
MRAIESNQFSQGEAGIFQPICRTLLEGGDHYLHIADFASYVEAQERVGRLFLDRSSWSAKAILNVARMGKFSSDRSIEEYAREIWGVQSLPPV